MRGVGGEGGKSGVQRSCKRYLGRGTAVAESRRTGGLVLRRRASEGGCGKGGWAGPGEVATSGQARVRADTAAAWRRSHCQGVWREQSLIHRQAATPTACRGQLRGGRPKEDPVEGG